MPQTQNPNIIQSSAVSLMIKPVGALCNLDCSYCYYLPTKEIYDSREHRMSLDILESIFAGYLPYAADQTTIAWQGGEPLLAGLSFFKKAIEFQNKYKRPNQVVTNALQTNGTLITEPWCNFLRENEFLVGISIDGDRRLHDQYRLTNAHHGSHRDVIAGLRLLQEHNVEYNILCVLNNINVHQPAKVFNYMVNLGSQWLQFIPAIEWLPDPKNDGQNQLAPYSPDPIAYGKFLCEVFDIWFEKYRDKISIRIFDVVMNVLVTGRAPLCIHDNSCHGQMTVEHNGDTFGCDHFVERRWQLSEIGNPEWKQTHAIIGDETVGLTVHGRGYRPNAAHEGLDIETQSDIDQKYTSTQSADGKIDDDWFKRADSGRLATFASRKSNLPEKCIKCQYKPFCHGGCPKHRSKGGDIPEPTILCDAYMMFFNHCMLKMQWLCQYISQGMQPPPPEKAPK